MSVLAPQAAPGGVSRTLAAFLKASRRSWWQARYRGGKVVAEWETAKIALPVPLPGGLGRSSRWETLDKRGLVGLRLLCPEGRVGELVAGSDFKLFQLKSGVLRLGQGTEIRGHLVGLVTSSEGACTCFAWEPGHGLVGPFYDNVLDLKYDNIGPLGLEAVGVKL